MHLVESAVAIDDLTGGAIGCRQLDVVVVHNNIRLLSELFLFYPTHAALLNGREGFWSRWIGGLIVAYYILFANINTVYNATFRVAVLVQKPGDGSPNYNFLHLVVNICENFHV